MAAKPDLLDEFYAEYKSYVESVLEPNRREIKRRLSKWRDPAHWASRAGADEQRVVEANPRLSPVQRSPFVRLKSPESVVDKIDRRTDVFPEGLDPACFRRMHDTIGGRVVVYFLSHLPVIDHEIHTNPDFEISAEDPPQIYLPRDVAERLGLSDMQPERKDSGYASLHYILRLSDSVFDEENNPLEERPWFELQVRTLAEDAWANIEHLLGYKPGRETAFAVREQFALISKHILAVDEHFNFIYRELQRFQREQTFTQNSVLNAENLPAVLSSSGIGCAEHQVTFMLRILHSNGIERVRDLRALATPDNVSLIRNTCERKGLEATDIHVVALLPLMKGARNVRDKQRKIEIQLGARDWWGRFMRDGP